MTTIRDCVDAAAAAFGLEPRILVSERRDQYSTLARHVAFWLARETTDASSTMIGRAVGKRDHTTVLHGIDRVAQKMAVDPQFAALGASLKQTLDFREKLAAFGDVDVLATARRIAAKPQREAVGATVFQITALAVFFLDAWEVATTAEELAACLRELARREATPAAERPDDDLFAVANSLIASIESQMAALRGDNEEQTDERP